MADRAQTDDAWERKQAVAAAMVDFLEGWVVRELCRYFRKISDALYSQTPEQLLIMALLEAGEPLTLTEIASRCHASRFVVLPDGRVRRAMERMERCGLILRRGTEDKPKFYLNRQDPACRLVAMIFSEQGQRKAWSLRVSGRGSAFRWTMAFANDRQESLQSAVISARELVRR
jgi:hypothetical protein